MISCTEFIVAYNELFNFLYARDGMESLQDFWRSISEQYLTNLDQLVQEKGIDGMAEYWGKTLEEEAAGYEIMATENVFTIQMHSCPSVARLNESDVEKSPYYCDHCAALYGPIMERAGFTLTMEDLNRDLGSCRLVISKRKEEAEVDA